MTGPTIPPEVAAHLVQNLYPRGNNIHIAVSVEAVAAAFYHGNANLWLMVTPEEKIATQSALTRACNLGLLVPCKGNRYAPA